MSIKASFSNVANVLLDWNDAHDEDFCSWRGVFCDNVTLSVASLWVLSLCEPSNRLLQYLVLHI